MASRADQAQIIFPASAGAAFSTRTAFSLTSAAGWTVDAVAPMTVVFGAGGCVLSTPALTSSLANRPRISRAVPFRPQSCDIRWNFRVDVGDNNGGNTRIQLAQGTVDVLTSAWVMSGAGFSTWANAGNSQEGIINGAGVALQVGPTAAQRTGGNLWFRTIFYNGLITMAWGIGPAANLEPTAWTFYTAQSALATNSQVWADAARDAGFLAFNALTIDALLATAFTVTVLNCVVYDLSAV